MVKALKHRSQPKTVNQVIVEAEIARLLASAPNQELPLGEVASAVVRSTNLTAQSVYYRIGRMKSVEKLGKRTPDARLRLIADPRLAPDQEGSA